MKKDVKSAIADILLQEKVEYVFGHTGWHIMHMWEAVNNAKINIIFNKHEWNAVFMADWYTRVSKKIGIILWTAGPGATNMLTWLATAYLDSIPLIAICASVATNIVWRNPAQDGSGRWRSIDQKQTFKSVCKQAMLAQSPESVPGLIREAFRIALSWRPGPVYVEIPSNFWNIEIEYNLVTEGKYKNLNLACCNLIDSEKIKEKLYKAKKPLIIIWEWAEENWINLKLETFLNNIKIPFSVSPMAKNFIDEFNPYFLGVMRWSWKTQKVYEYMKTADLVLFLWDRMQQVEMKWYSDELIENNKILAQVDIDPDEIGRVYPVDYSCIWSISSFIDLVGKNEHKNASKLLESIEKLKNEYPRIELNKDSDIGINPVNIINITEKYASNDTTIVCDTGNPKSLAILKFRTNSNQNFLTADKNGPMWYSIPAALWAALATKKEVICFVWDWWFQMSFNELGVCLNYELKVIYIIFNNNGCHTIKRIQSAMYWSHCATCFENPNFGKLAEWFNMKNYSVKTSKEFEEAFKKAQQSKVSIIIEAIIDDDLIIWE